MNPIDLILWGAALAVAVVLVGVAIYLVAALYYGLQQSRNRHGR